MPIQGECRFIEDPARFWRALSDRVRRGSEQIKLCIRRNRYFLWHIFWLGVAAFLFSLWSPFFLKETILTSLQSSWDLIETRSLVVPFLLLTGFVSVACIIWMYKKNRRCLIGLLLISGFLLGWLYYCEPSFTYWFVSVASLWGMVRLAWQIVASLPAEIEEDEEEDCLNRDFFIEKRMNNLVKTLERGKARIAVVGAWGEGKTFVLKRIRGRLRCYNKESDKQIKTAWIYPWSAETLEKAWDEIVEAIEQMIYSRRTFRSIIRRFPLLYRLTNALPWSDHGIAALLCEILHTESQERMKYLKQKLDKICEYQTLVLFIDDMERSRPEIVQGLFPVFDKLHQVSQLSIIAAIEPKQLFHVFKTLDEGQGYLDKIFTEQWHLPSLSFAELRHMALRRLLREGNETSQLYKILSIEGCDILNYVSLPRTPRLLLHYIRHMAELEQCFGMRWQEEDMTERWRAFFVVETFRMEYPELYEEVRHIARKDRHSIPYLHSTEEKDEINDEDRKNFQRFLPKCYKAWESDEYARSLLKTLRSCDEISLNDALAMGLCKFTTVTRLEVRTMLLQQDNYLCIADAIAKQHGLPAAAIGKEIIEEFWSRFCELMGEEKTLRNYLLYILKNELVQADISSVNSAVYHRNLIVSLLYYVAESSLSDEMQQEIVDTLMQLSSFYVRDSLTKIFDPELIKKHEKKSELFISHVFIRGKKDNYNGQLDVISFARCHRQLFDLFVGKLKESIDDELRHVYVESSSIFDQWPSPDFPVTRNQAWYKTMLNEIRDNRPVNFSLNALALLMLPNSSDRDNPTLNNNWPSYYILLDAASLITIDVMRKLSVQQLEQLDRMLREAERFIENTKIQALTEQDNRKFLLLKRLHELLKLRLRKIKSEAGS